MSDDALPTNQGEPPTSPYVVIARRYRPQTFEDLIGQEHVAKALQQAIVSNRVGHAYLFTGARGVGKTSAARILAKALNCVHGPTPTPCNECDICQSVSAGDDVDVLEIDGASNNGVDQVRQLRQNAAVRPTRTRFKIYIIDEVHMLSGSAFNALLKTLEEPPEHVKFVFATTEPQKIPITILSRCQRFDFAGINAAAIQARLKQIAEAEGAQVEPEALQILASRAAGSMRDSQSLLEQLLAVGHGSITRSDVNELLGIAPAERLSGLVQHLIARNPAAALAELDAAIENGGEVGLLLDQLVGYFRDVMVTCVGCGPDQLLYALPSQSAEVANVGKQLGLPTVLAIVQIFDQTSARMRVSMHGRTLLEMAVVRACQIDDLDDLASLVDQLRGTAPSTPSGDAAVAEAKKNDEPHRTSLAEAVVAIGRLDSPHANHSARQSVPPRPDNVHPTIASEAEPSVATSEPLQVTEMAGQAPTDSVLAQWQRALSEKNPERPAPPTRLSRREQSASVAEQPFVHRAMELFDVPPDKIRYTPPESDSN